MDLEDEKPFDPEMTEGAERALNERLIISLEGFEGPLDLLLHLARDQKVDLTQISVLDLAEQYLSFIEQAHDLRLEIAADYLVMAAWLAYLKARLLIPIPQETEAQDPTHLAADLAFQLQRLEAMRQAAIALFERPHLGQERFWRGASQTGPTIETTESLEADFYDLLRAYARLQVRVEASTLQLEREELYKFDAALARLEHFLGDSPDWATLFSYLPAKLRAGIQQRSAIASFLLASLELVRQGKLELRQQDPFGPILIRPKQVP